MTTTHDGIVRYHSTSLLWYDHIVFEFDETRKAFIKEQLARLGAQIKNARIQASMNQEQLGSAAGNLSRQLVSRVESGHPNGEIGAFIALADALGYTVTLRSKTPTNRGEKAALDLIAQLRQGPTQ